MKSLVYHLQHLHNIVNRTAMNRPAPADEQVENLVQTSVATTSQIAVQAQKRQKTLDEYCSNKPILNMEITYYAVEETKQQIQKMEDDAKKLSATLDEWTSSINTRFLNFNLHYTISPVMNTSHINLGLVKIKKIEFVRNLNLFDQLILHFNLNLALKTPRGIWSRKSKSRR